MRVRSVFLLLSLAVVVIACDDQPLTLDMALSAKDGSDVTSVFEGCGKITDGYLFCRIAENSPPTTKIKIHFPDINCSRDSCIKFQFYRPDGSDGYGAAVQKGQTEASLTVADLIGHSGPVTMDDSNEYQVAVDVAFSVKGQEHYMRADGLVRLWVYDEAYTRLFCADPETGWMKQISENCHAYYSTQYRTRVCGEGC